MPFQDSSTGPLWQAARQGDREAFENLVAQLHPSVFRLALGMVGDYQDAEDVAQEVFLKAYLALPGLRPDTAHSAWLRRVTLNASLDHLRRRRRRRWWPWSSLPAGPGTGQESEAPQGPDAELSRQVQQALQKLPEPYRAVAVLRELEGLSYEEIGQVLGCAIGTVQSRLARARERLREVLKPVYRDWIKK